MKANAYLAYNGNCEEAFKFYEKCLRGKILMMMKYKDAPMDGQHQDAAEKIIHARIDLGDSLIMGSDAPANQFKPHNSGIMINLNIEEPAEADRVFKELSAGGEVTMPITETFWAHRFAMFFDRFGIPWMVNCEKKM